MKRTGSVRSIGSGHRCRCTIATASRRYKRKMEDDAFNFRNEASTTVTAVVDDPTSSLSAARVAAPSSEETPRKMLNLQTTLHLLSINRRDVGSISIKCHYLFGTKFQENTFQNQGGPGGRGAHLRRRPR